MALDRGFATGVSFVIHTPLGIFSFRATRICAHVSRGEDADTLPAFGYWLKKGVYKKGSKRTIEDAECQEWTAMIPVQNRRPDEEAKVCLGVVDNLPLYHRWSMGEFTFSAWNVPNDIQAPAFVAGTNP